MNSTSVQILEEKNRKEANAKKTQSSTLDSKEKAIKISQKDFIVLTLLKRNPKGLYGSEMVELSSGQLGRGTIYSLLERLQEKGFITEKEDPPTAAYRIARTRHFLTRTGVATVDAYLKQLGLAIDQSEISKGLLYGAAS